MKISVNAIRDFNKRYQTGGDPAPEGVDHLVRKIGDQLGAVEEVIPFGEKFEGVIVAKVVSCEAHPNADRLHVCKIDDGGAAVHVEHDENGHVQVVCGAPNVREGLTVAWLPPGATVPSTFYDPDSFVLDARKLRGVLSNGMLASPKELGIGDSHEGIMELDDHIPAGTPFAEAYDLRGDVVIDIENKMFTHRPDCFGQLGVAREIAGIYGQPYKSPDWYVQNPEFPAIEGEELKLEVFNDVQDIVPRITAVAMSSVTIKDSPVWLQIYLTQMGLRPINNIVDYTNFFMLETGQPLHAYDYDKFAARCSTGSAVLGARRPKEGEKMLLLNGKEIVLRPEDIVIATDQEPVGLGGAMGGGDTEVDANTENIILECANFDMYTIRRTSMAHGVFSDAVTRFTKGQSPLQNLAVLAKIVDEIRRYAGGKVASAVIDNNHVSTDAVQRGNVHPPVTITVQFINERLGLHLSVDEITTILRNVEFSVAVQGEELTVTAPFWRTDIAIPEDVVEEVGRLYGYDHLPLELPRRDLTPARKDELLEAKQRIRTRLARAGANEVLSYSFAHGNLLDKAGQDRSLAFQLSNAISPDLQYYRLSLTPSLLEKVHPNVKAGYSEFALFELGKTHQKGQVQDDKLPTEFEMLSLVYANAKPGKQGAAYYQARHFLDILAKSFGVDLEFTQDGEFCPQTQTPFEPGRSSLVRIAGSEELLGVVGEFRASVRKGLKLPEHSAGFELDYTQLAKRQNQNTYVPLPKFPAVTQDICLKVPAELPYGDLYQFVSDHLYQNRPDETAHTLSPIDIYQRPDDQAHKQTTLRLQIASFERTLTDEEVNTLLDSVAQAAQNKLAAQRV